MWRLRNILAAMAFVAFASTGGALAAEAWTWFVGAGGEASGSLASLSALDVTDARGGDNLYPGQTMALRVNVRNENPVVLTLVQVSVGDLKSGDEACDASLADSRLRFDATPDVNVKPGENDGVVLGSFKLPRLLAQSCQGKTITAPVTVKAAYGVAG